MKKEQDLLQRAQSIAQEVETWADLSNALFDPLVGIVARAFPEREARETFVQTDEYKQIRQLMTDAMHRFGVIEGSTPKLRIGLLAEEYAPPSREEITSHLWMEMPATLFDVLNEQADAAGVSLKQLVLSKLSAPPSKLVA